MGAPQTLSEADRRIVAVWAADCAERVLGLFEAQALQDRRPRDAIARTRAFARGGLDVAEEIRRRLENGGAARDADAPAALAAAKAAGQAAAIPHMGAHALGAAAYAAKAVGLAAPDRATRGRCKQRDSLAAQPCLCPGEGRAATAPARRREQVRSPRAGAPRIRTAGQHRPRTSSRPGRPRPHSRNAVGVWRDDARSSLGRRPCADPQAGRQSPAPRLSPGGARC